MHVITHFAMGGAENVAIGLCERLRAEFDFSVFAVIAGPRSAVGEDMVDRLDAAGAKVFTGASGRFKSGGVIVAALRLGAAIRSFQPDVIHLHTEIPELTAAVASVLSARFRKTRVVRTVHNSTLWIDWARIGAWVTDRHATARAVAVSQAAADADAQIATRRPRARAQIIYNGVTSLPQGSAGDQGSTGQAVATQSERPLRVIFAGRLVEQKGADLLPEILSVARSLVLRDDVEVTIAGEGPLADRLWQDIQSCAPRWHVEMVPPISGLAARLARYDVLLMPSRFEGFALLPLEAMMAGLPLIVSRAPGIDEALPGDYPFVAAPCDARQMGALLAQVLNEPEATRRSVQRFAATIASRFSVERMTLDYARLYRELATGERVSGEMAAGTPTAGHEQVIPS